MLELRDYQKEAVSAVYDYFQAESGNPLVVLPTASGKSLVMADFCKGVVEQWPDQRILVVTHVRELVAQNYLELMEAWPAAPAGIYSAGLNRRDQNAQILFCSIQSVWNKIAQIQWADLVLCDECHLIPRKSNTMYRKFFDAMLKINPHMKIIGLSATPYRLDSGMLHRGDGALFSDIAYEKPVGELVTEGFLSPLVSKQMKTQIDTSGVHKRGGEFIAGELERAVDIEAITKAAVAEIMDYGQARRSWIVFGTGVSHCEHIAEEIRSYGISAECVFGHTPKVERGNLINRFKSFDLRCLVSRDVLTTGFNAPAVDLIAMLRPTQSTGLYVQIAGRGMRLAPGKSDCLVLDFAKNVLRHGPIDQIQIDQPAYKEKDEPGEAPVKACPECGSFALIAATECPDCGYLYPPPAPKIQQSASTLAIMSNGQPDWIPVDDVSYRRHISRVNSDKPKPPMLLAVYQSGLSAFYKDYVCLEHEGMARRKAESWWRQRAGTMPPTCVDEALERVNELKAPREIAITRQGKWMNVSGARF